MKTINEKCRNRNKPDDCVPNKIQWSEESQLPHRPRSCLMMAEVQQPHKQHIATLPHTTTSSPVTTTPQQLLQKQHNHSKIIKKKEISLPRFNVCRLVFFSNAPASAAAPASRTELSDDGGGSAATQTTHTMKHIRFRRQIRHDVFFASHSLVRSKDVIAGSLLAMRPTASCTCLLIFSLIFAVCRMSVERTMLILICRALFGRPVAAVFSARWSTRQPMERS